ncbi:hypothetical protein PBY51_015702 [Eleginops maclovinus]|nr:hypothetical protein PBY51_015702 [Eleginops maclovinus]
MNCRTSEHGVLLDWVCLPGRLCQSPTDTKKERKNLRNMERFTLPDAPPRRDKGKSQRVQGSEITLPFSSPHLIFLHCPFHLDGRYIVMSFKEDERK